MQTANGYWNCMPAARIYCAGTQGSGLTAG
jgi:hypothetical protein